MQTHLQVALKTCSGGRVGELPVRSMNESLRRRYKRTLLMTET